jgi:hypothetical protein
MAARDQALQQLYQSTPKDFTAERKRLATELRGRGDEAAAKDLAARRRPTTSAWAVNQLYWHARDAFDDMLAAAKKVRKGDLDATGDLRDANAALRKRAAELLKEAGLAVSEALIRRVSTTLSAIAANGGFEPDEPGTLVLDRDPPGFEGLTVPETVGRTARDAPRPPARLDDELAAKRAERQQKQGEQAEREQRRIDSRRIRTNLHDARVEVARRERALAALRKDVAAAERAVAEAREAVDDLERRLRDLDE